MPTRSKKQKLSHQSHPGDPHRSLSHNEIWDDSALINSWNTALAEYEYYHSLAAQGLDVDGILDRAEEADAKGEEVDLALDDAGNAAEAKRPQESGVNGEDEEEVEEGEVEEGELAGDDDDYDDDAPVKQRVRNGKATRAGPQQPSSASLQHQPATATTTTTTTTANGESRATATAPDQTLENVKMAYYWAGYYSGMLDAQRQAERGIGHGSAEGSGG